MAEGEFVNRAPCGPCQERARQQLALAEQSRTHTVMLVALAAAVGVLILALIRKGALDWGDLGLTGGTR